jgi:hypothetical protein
VIICNRKQGHYNDRRICEMMTLNEIHCNPATSTFLSVVCLVLKSLHTRNSLLPIESTGRHTHHKQVKMVYYYIEKQSRRLQSQKLHIQNYYTMQICIVLHVRYKQLYMQLERCYYYITYLCLLRKSHL